ncbi:hypothetical protein U1Q18_005848, partial [Sarracenia purpurea var. burkii]
SKTKKKTQMPALKPYCFFCTSSSPWSDACSPTAIPPPGSEIYMPLAAAAISAVDSTPGLRWSTSGDVINCLGFFTPSAPINPRIHTGGYLRLQ